MTIGRLFLVLSIVLLAFFGKAQIIEDIIARLQSFNYFFAPLLILYLVSVLERTLDKFGFIHWIEDYLETRNLNRLSYAAIPGLIGLIPSVGGAHFACSIFPVSARKKLSGCRLAAINYFFRHFHVYSNPLIAGTVLACSITNTSLWFLALNLLPLSVLTFISGWYFLIPKRDENEEVRNVARIKFSPKTICLLVLITIETLVFFFLDYKIYLWLIIVNLTLIISSPAKVLFALIPMKDNIFLFSEVAFILIFASVVNSLGISQILTDFICNSGTPLWLAFSLITILLAYITGISQAYVAIIMPLVSVISGEESILVCWLLALGFYVQYLTPSHLCLVVCADFFKCSVLNLIKQIFPAVTMAFLFWLFLFISVYLI